MVYAPEVVSGSTSAGHQGGIIPAAAYIPILDPWTVISSKFQYLSSSAGSCTSVNIDNFLSLLLNLGYVKIRLAPKTHLLRVSRIKFFTCHSVLHLEARLISRMFAGFYLIMVSFTISWSVHLWFCQGCHQLHQALLCLNRPSENLGWCAPGPVPLFHRSRLSFGAIAGAT